MNIMRYPPPLSWPDELADRESEFEDDDDTPLDPAPAGHRALIIRAGIGMALLAALTWAHWWCCHDPEPRALRAAPARHWLDRVRHVHPGACRRPEGIALVAATPNGEDCGDTRGGRAQSSLCRGPL